MNPTESNLPPEDSPANPPRNEEELLDRESQMARGALARLREEIMQSLKRSADVKAWAVRFPWSTLGAAAVAGVGAGWAIGNVTRRGTSSEQNVGDMAGDLPASEREASTAAHSAGRLVSGLGTLAGALASAAIGAATQAVTDVVKETIHESLHPPAEADDGDSTAEESAQ